MLSIESSGRYDNDLNFWSALTITLAVASVHWLRSIVVPLADTWWAFSGVNAFQYFLSPYAFFAYSGIGRMYVTLSMGVALEPPGHEGVL